MASLTDLLTEAQTAYHEVQTGRGIAEARDSDGTYVKYSQANVGQLSAYIADLKAQIATAAGIALPSRAPMRIFL